jgi:hypothetical protein
MNFITSHDQWLEEYRKNKYNIWIRVSLSNDIEYYLPNHNSWMELKKICDSKKLKVNKLGLQYKSHYVEVDTSNVDGVYLVRSLKGTFGESTKQAITIGKVYGDIVKKTMWITPELIEDLKDEDPIDKCFMEALILYDKEETKQTRAIQ